MAQRAVNFISEMASYIFASLIAVFFTIGSKLFFKVHIKGLKNFKVEPSTIIVINHKRDLDVLTIVSALHLNKTIFHPTKMPRFMAREDLFMPGFLATHFNLPSLLGIVTNKINLRGVMHILHAHPICHLRKRKLKEWLWDIYHTCGNIEINKAFKPDWLIILKSQIPARKSPLLIKEFFNAKYSKLLEQREDVAILQHELCYRIKKYCVQNINQQLKIFSSLLDRGKILFIAPEGDLSPDGGFKPFKSTLYRLVQTSKADVRILPINITYDSVSGKKLNVYISVGKELTNVKTLNKLTLENMVHRSVEMLTVITATQLMSEKIVDNINKGKYTFEPTPLLTDIFMEINSLKNKGLQIEKTLLDRLKLESILQNYVSYGVKRNWFIKSNGHLLINHELILNNQLNGYQSNPIIYSYNEIQGVRKALQTVS